MNIYILIECQSIYIFTYILTYIYIYIFICTSRWLLFISYRNSLVSLNEGLCSSNPREFESSCFNRNRTDDPGINSSGPLSDQLSYACTWGLYVYTYTAKHYLRFRLPRKSGRTIQHHRSQCTRQCSYGCVSIPSWCCCSCFCVTLSPHQGCSVAKSLWEHTTWLPSDLLVAAVWVSAFLPLCGLEAISLSRSLQRTVEQRRVGSVWSLITCMGIGGAAVLYARSVWIVSDLDIAYFESWSSSWDFLDCGRERGFAALLQLMEIESDNDDDCFYYCKK